MSAYVVENKVIDRIVSWIDMTYKGRDTWDVRHIADAGFDLSKEEEIARLAQAMFWLNCEAVNDRYGEGQASEFRPLDYQYKFTLNYGNIYQVLKSLKCWLYQCSEGNVPESELYKVMDKLANNIAMTIATKSQQYETATW